MTCNIGNTDRVIRIVLGVAVIGAGFYFQSWWGSLGAIPVLTSAFKFCPVYPLIGVNTCSRG